VIGSLILVGGEQRDFDGAERQEPDDCESPHARQNRSPLHLSSSMRQRSKRLTAPERRSTRFGIPHLLAIALLALFAVAMLDGSAACDERGDAVS
jgi:hypothetical protein